MPKVLFDGDPEKRAEASMDARMMGAKAAAAKWGCSVRTMQSLKTEEGEPADPGDREAYVTALYRKMERTSSQLQDVVGVCNRLLLKDDAKILKDLAARPDGAGAETLSKIAHNAMRGVEVTIPKQNVTKKSEEGLNWQPPPPAKPMQGPVASAPQANYDTVQLDEKKVQ